MSLTELTKANLLEALEANMTQWVTWLARADQGEVHRTAAVTWVYTTEPGGEYSILFPRIPTKKLDAQLDRMLGYYRERPAAQPLICWSGPGPKEDELHLRLQARGFELPTQATGMACDLSELDDSASVMEGMTFEPADASLWELYEHPYWSRQRQHWRRCIWLRQQVAASRPKQVRHLTALFGGEPLGHATVVISRGRLGVAGIYDLGVVPAARQRGVGRAIAAAACQFGREQGCGAAVLTASRASESVYRRVGFKPLGAMSCCSLPRGRLARPPAPELIELAMAAGSGNVRALSAFAAAHEQGSLNWALANGMGALDLAAQLGQAAAAEWLVAHGLRLNLVAAAQLGWHGRIPDLLAKDPRLLHQRSEPHGMTPLHFAAMTGDMNLASILLDAGADAQCLDMTYKDTPLGWARTYGHAEIAALVEARQGDQAELPGPP